VIARIFKKDWILLWPMVMLVTAIQTLLEWSDYDLSVINANAAAVDLIRPLTVAWVLGIAALVVAVVHQDPIPGVEQDWLIRPIKRTDLLMAKMLFLLATISMPMMVLNLVHALAIGFPFADVIGVIVYKELYTFVFLILPLMALGAATRNLTELTLLGAGLVIAYAACLASSAYFWGTARCPTCGSGLVWQQHLLQHVELGVGAVVVLSLQYFRRRTPVSRVLILLAAAALVFVQLPWAAAFAIQQRLSGHADAPTGVNVAVAGALTVENPDTPQRSARRQATRALMNGDVDQAFGYLERGGGGASTRLEIPLEAHGLAADELLLVDRGAAHLGDANRVLYRRDPIEEDPGLLSPPAMQTGATPDVPRQTIRVPSALLTNHAAEPRELTVDYWLTRMKVIEEHRLPALDGELRSPEAGVCRSHLEEDIVLLQCRRVGPGQFCLSATLYGPDGAHDAEARRCLPDYRPYMPAYVFVLSYFSLELPVRDHTGAAHYAVDPADFDRSYLVFKIYGQRAHFTQSVGPVRVGG